MALTLTKAFGVDNNDLSGTYSFIKLDDNYEFERNADNTVTVRKAEYAEYTTKTLEQIDFGDTQVFSCMFTTSDGDLDYTPDGGLKLWKIQRRVYRLIGSAERVVDTTMYYDGEIDYSHSRTSDLPYTMKVNDASEDWLHFEWMDANARMSEIMNQCDANDITCTIRMRLKTGKCVSVITAGPHQITHNLHSFRKAECVRSRVVSESSD